MKKNLQPAPIGIDLGTYKSKIAVAKRGGVEIITNDANFRETPCVVGFGPAQRNVGQAGYIKMKSNFRDTVVAPQRFVGLSVDYPHLHAETKHCPAKNTTESGQLQFQVNYQGQKELLKPVQVLAAYFNKLKSIMEYNGYESKEAVIAIPPYLTQIERKGILNAAKIAELNVTRLLNESTAIALDYGIFRKADLDAKNPRNVLFVDFGHTQFGCFCCSFTKDQMNTLTQHCERNLGCRDLDQAVLEFYRQYFMKTSGGCDIFENKKAVVKLMQNIERQRKILSGNTDFDMNVQYLMQENDLRYTMTRDEFNNICKPVFQKLQKILLDVREQLKAKNIQLHSVELIGGGTRIPEFLRIVKEVFGHEPSRTLNSSQSVARGSALMAAIKSPLFRVAQYTLNEKAYYGIKFSWNFVEGNNFLGTNSDAYPEKQRKMIFEAGHKVPSSKTIKFARKEAIEILVQYDPPVPGFNKHIAYYVTKPQNPKQETFGVQFKLKYTEDGLITFSDCMLIEEWTEQIKTPKPKKTPAPTPAQNQSPTGESKQGENQQSAPEQPQQAQPMEQEFDIKKVKKQRATEVKYDANTFDQHTEKQLQDFFTLESTMLNQDRILIETYEKKNELQSLAYNWKQKLQGSHKHYAKPETIPEILAHMEGISEWLYGQGQDSNRGTYTQKIEEAQQKVHDIQKRYDMYENLGNEFVVMNNALKKNMDSIQSKDQKYSHITHEERQPVLKELQAHHSWLQQVENKHTTHPKWENPLVSVHDVKERVRNIEDSTRKLMSKPVPKPAQPTRMDEEKTAQQPTGTPGQPSSTPGQPDETNAQRQQTPNDTRMEEENK